MASQTVDGHSVAIPQAGYRGFVLLILRLVAAWTVVFPLLMAWALVSLHQPGWALGSIVAAGALLALMRLNRPMDIIAVDGDHMVIQRFYDSEQVAVEDIEYIARSRRQDLGIPLTVYVALKGRSGLLRKRLILVVDGERVVIRWANAHRVRVLNDGARD